MNTFRVGLSASFTRADGKTTFPSADWSGLAALDGVDMVPLPAAAVLSADQLDGFDAVVLLGERIRRDSLPADRRLGLIARMGVGYDTLDVPACTDNDTAITITPEGVCRPMASSIVTLILALGHRLFEKDRVCRTGNLGWPARFDLIGTGLTGRTVGSVGLGNIGGEMFRLITPFEVRKIAHDPYCDPDRARALGVTLVDLDTVFRESDFLCFNCPLTPETKGIGSADGIARMKPTAYLINTSRGPVVDQTALYRALVDGRIAGAGLDVFDPEPPPFDAPILRLGNVIVTPHALGFLDQMFATMARVNTAAVKAMIEGRNPDNVVNRDVLDRPGWKARLGRG